MYETFEKLVVVWYKFGLAMNDGLNASFNDLLARAEVQFKKTSEKDRLFMSIYYKAKKTGLAKRAGPGFVIPYALGIPMEVQANGKDERAFGRGSIESTSDLMR